MSTAGPDPGGRDPRGRVAAPRSPGADRRSPVADPRALRDAFGAFATGVTIVTTVDPRLGFVGLTANSFCPVSASPPIVCWSLARASASCPAFEAAGHFAVHVLAESQLEWSRRFAARGVDRFAGLRPRIGRGGVPLLDGCCAVLECATEAVHDGGDHLLFVGRVLGAEHRRQAPLVFASGGYRRVGCPADEG